MSYVERLFSLEGKLAVVTGAARGNGKAIAEALLKAGAAAILVDVLEEELLQTVTAFKGEGLDAREAVCDLTDGAQIAVLANRLREEEGHVDVLVNNAGVTFTHELLDYPADAWDKTYEVNLKAVFELSKAVAGIMKERGSGSIINITSLNAELAFPDNPAYVACKGAVRQLTKSLALDLGKYGIRANNVGPGYFKTEMTRRTWENPETEKKRAARTALGRWGMPQDLAGLVVFLASDASSYVTGQDIYVDGGWLIKGL